MSKAYKVLDEVQKLNMSHDTDKWCKVWRKTDSWFQIRAVASLKICNLKCYYCRKYIILLPKKYRGVMSSSRVMWRMMQNLERNRLALWKMTWGILANFDPTLESLKICTLMGSFWPKYITFQLEKYRGVMRHCTEDRCKLQGKNDVWL